MKTGVSASLSELTEPFLSRSKEASTCKKTFYYGGAFLVGVAITGLILLIFLGNGSKKPEKSFLLDMKLVAEHAKNQTIANRKRIIGYYDLKDMEELSLKQLSKLTHVIFGPVEWFVDGRLEKFVEWKREHFELLKLKAKMMKIQLIFNWEIGGKGEQTFANLNTSGKTKRILSTIIAFIKEHDLNGINIDWNWDIFDISDKSLLIDIIKETRHQLNQIQGNSRILSLEVSKRRVELDFNEILKYVDFLNIQSDNYVTPDFRDIPVMGPPNPLFSNHPDVGDVNNTMQYYIKMTKQPGKLNMRISFLCNLYYDIPVPSNDSTWNPVMKPIDAKVSGEQRSYWIMMHRGKWEMTYNPVQQVTYYWDPKEGVYLDCENVNSIWDKGKYAIDNGIGGFTVWKPMYDVDNMLIYAVSSFSE